MFLALPFALVVLTVVALRSARVAVAFGLHALLGFALFVTEAVVARRRAITSAWLFGSLLLTLLGVSAVTLVLGGLGGPFLPMLFAPAGVGFAAFGVSARGVALWALLSLALLVMLTVGAPFPALEPGAHRLVALGAASASVLLLLLGVGGVLVGRGVPRLRALPTWGLVAFQAFRAPLEFTLYALHREGLVPAQLTFTGRNFDVLVGLTAPLVAWLAATGRASPRLLKVWNALGVLLLGVGGLSGAYLRAGELAVRASDAVVAAAHERARAIEELNGHFAHELKNPLAALGHVALAARLLRGERGEGPHVAPTAAQSRSSSR